MIETSKELYLLRLALSTFYLFLMTSSSGHTVHVVDLFCLLSAFHETGLCCGIHVETMFKFVCTASHLDLFYLSIINWLICIHLFSFKFVAFKDCPHLSILQQLLQWNISFTGNIQDLFCRILCVLIVVDLCPSKERDPLVMWPNNHFSSKCTTSIFVFGAKSFLASQKIYLLDFSERLVLACISKFLWENSFHLDLNAPLLLFWVQQSPLKAVIRALFSSIL